MLEDTEERAFVAAQIDSGVRWSRRGQKWWSFANHGATVLIVVFSATAAVLSQTTTTDIVSVPVKDIATALALMVTIIATIQSKLGFERKWMANRMTHSALCQLEIDANTGTELVQLTRNLKTILARHDQAILGISNS